MASTRAMIERRRFSRVGTRIPVTVFGEHSQDQCPEASAEATAISRSGALVRVPFAPTLGSRTIAPRDAEIRLGDAYKTRRRKSSVDSHASRLNSACFRD